MACPPLRSPLVEEEVCSAAAQREFLAMEWAGIISRSTGSPWAAPLHTVKKSGHDEWRPYGDHRQLNLRTITDLFVIPNLHSLNFKLKGKHVFP